MQREVGGGGGSVKTCGGGATRRCGAAGEDCATRREKAVRRGLRWRCDAAGDGAAAQGDNDVGGGGVTAGSVETKATCPALNARCKKRPLHTRIEELWVV